MDTEQTTPTPAPAPAMPATPSVASEPAPEKAANENRTLMGVLAYLGVLIVVPYLMAKDDSFVHFHIKQGAVICIIWLIGYVAMMFVWLLTPFIAILNLGLFVLAIVGIVNVVKGKEEALPLVGGFAKDIPL